MAVSNNQTHHFLTWIATQDIIQTDSHILYDDMETQSGYSLPVIYQPFDPQRRGHWHDAGLIQDFLHAARIAGKKVLDFGPGDGWPSLLIAPFVAEVVGVDSSEKRVRVCKENAYRMNIRNATFVHYEAGKALPFPDESFDGVVAASSVEQCPNPREILSEFYRILKPGGRLRMYYEGLSMYKGGKEYESWIFNTKDNRCSMLIYLRDIPGEKTVHYKIDFSLAKEVLMQEMNMADDAGIFSLDSAAPEKLNPYIDTVYTYTLLHPSCATWIQWLKEAGFSVAKPTHDAGSLAVAMYESCTADDSENMSLSDIYERINTIAPWVCELEAPMDNNDPLILAIK